MAEKTPVRINYDGSNNAIGFAEYQTADYIGLEDGGTGHADRSQQMINKRLFEQYSIDVDKNLKIKTRCYFCTLNIWSSNFN